MHEATRDDTPDATNCLKFVAIMQEAFHDGTLSKESIWQIVVLIPKEAIRDFRGVVLVEVLWKAVTSLLNRRLTAAITFHDVLHGFWAGRGTGTVALEANLLQHLTAMREVVLFEVLLDLQKAYESLD